MTTSSTAYTSSTTYPSDTKLYWRVGAIDERGVRLDWSATGTFVRRLLASTPAPGNPTGGSDIPVLAWTPVLGAISYDVHVDYVDGETKDVTVFSPSLTPTEFYGNGIWHWKVRANFPTTSGAKNTSGGYFPAQEYVRTVGRTPNVRGSVTASRVLLSWDPDPTAKTYSVEVSASSGFGDSVDRVSTKTTSYAPTLAGAPYDGGGRLFWRVASVINGNVGPYTTGTFILPRAIHATLSGYLQHGLAGTISVELKDAKGHAVHNAKVRVTGRGLRSATRRSSKAGVATFRLKAKRAGELLTFTVTRRGYRDAVATTVVG